MQYSEPVFRYEKREPTQKKLHSVSNFHDPDVGLKASYNNPCEHMEAQRSPVMYPKARELAHVRDGIGAWSS